MSVRVNGEQIRAFRLRGHGLDESSEAATDPTAAMLDAAGRCGVQNSPPGSALLALDARVGALSAAHFEGAIAEDRSLLQTWSLRGAPYLFPTADAALFTNGVLPPTEEAARRFLPGVVPALDALDITLTAMTDDLAAELPAVLAGRQLDIHELGTELAPRVEPRLSAAQRALWREEGPHAPGQSQGEAVVHFAVRLLALRGLVCLAPRTEALAQFVLLREFLGAELPEADPALARADLLRRYLRCFGPATRADFADWVGVGSRDAEAWWGLCADELVPVDTASGERWLLASDVPALTEAASELASETVSEAVSEAATDPAKGVRLLPPSDPYLRQPDREVIVPRERHAEVWRTVGAPGVALRDGIAVASWRARLRGRRLDVTFTPWGALSRQARDQLADAAERMARLRGAARARVECAPG